MRVKISRASINIGFRVLNPQSPITPLPKELVSVKLQGHGLRFGEVTIYNCAFRHFSNFKWTRRDHSFSISS